MITPIAAGVKPLGFGARLLSGYHLGRLFKRVQPGKLLLASLPNLGASNAGYRCSKDVTGRRPQKESHAQFEAFCPHDSPPPSIFLSLPRLGLTDNRVPVIQQARASKRLLLHCPVEIRSVGSVRKT
jgi:hypothetical protein